MLQELFRLPILDLPIYSYGLMMVIGFLAAMQLAKYLAKRCGLDGEIFVNACLIALVTGVAGARLSHVIENIERFTDPNRSAWANFVDAINIRSGGLTYYGGFLLAFPSLVFYAMIRRIDEHTFEVDARVRLDELNRNLHTNLPEDAGYETLGGFVSTTLGRVPQSGVTFEQPGMRFTIVDAEPQKVNGVRIELVPQPADEKTPATA